MGSQGRGGHRGGTGTSRQERCVQTSLQALELFAICQRDILEAIRPLKGGATTGVALAWTKDLPQFDAHPMKYY